MTKSPAPPAPDGVHPGATAIVERLEVALEKLGTIHDRKFDAEERDILAAILQTDDGTAFEGGHERLGQLLGYAAGNSTDDAAPDPWWIGDDTICFVFEDHAEAKKETVLSVRKARQAVSHPDWLREHLGFSECTEIISVLITPCTKAAKGAIPTLRKVRYWSLDDFCSWAKNALRVIRDIRRDFPGIGNLAWRTAAVARLKEANIAPEQLKHMLSKSAADVMSMVDSEADTP